MSNMELIFTHKMGIGDILVVLISNQR